MKKIVLSAIIVLLSISTIYAQSYVGHSIDNFAGIHSAIYNPANVVNSHFRTDINLFSGSAFVGSDYFGVNFGDFLNATDGFDFENSTAEFPKDDNHFFINTDFVGPSFMLNLSPKSSIGLITRGRGFLNVNEINGRLYENLTTNFDGDEDFSFNSSNLNTTLHAWTEIGLAYGRILVAKQKHMLSGGATFKYLMGAGSIYVNTPGLQGDYTASTETIQSQGFLNYGTTQGFDENNINLDNITSGFGLDVGFVYEWHPNRDGDDPLKYYQDPYKLKIALSVTDIGSIRYDNAEITNYDLNGTVSTSTYEDDIEEFLNNNYNNTSNDQSATIQLPTAIHMLIDYRLANHWLISAQADISMVNSSEALSSRIINSYILSPRYESKWFTFFTPIGFRQYDDFVFGGGFRLGPLSIGSGSVFSNLLSSESKTTDLFVGLKIPIYRK